jgi:hypothetical protein
VAKGMRVHSICSLIFLISMLFFNDDDDNEDVMYI